MIFFIFTKVSIFLRPVCVIVIHLTVFNFKLASFGGFLLPVFWLALNCSATQLAISVCVYVNVPGGWRIVGTLNFYRHQPTIVDARFSGLRS